MRPTTKSHVEKLVEQFNNIVAQIKRKNASKRPIKIKIREYLVTYFWNEIVRALAHYDQETIVDIQFVVTTLDHCNQELQSCLHTLNSRVEVGSINEFVTLPELTSHEKTAVDKILKEIPSGSGADLIERAEEEVESEDTSANKNAKMPQSEEEFFRLASKVIDTKFDGDPSNLEAFIDQVELLEPMVEAGNKGNLVKFVKTRLTGTAREALPDNPQNVKEIINALKTEIKYDPSQVIEGKIISLRVDKRNNAKFAEKAEKLAEELRRSLIFEGHTRAKAQEMTIRQTVDLCYKSTRSETVKAVLAATPFQTPSEVISGFVIQQDKVRQDTSLQSKNNNGYGNGNRNRGFGQKSRGNFRGNSRGNYRNNNQNRGQSNRSGNYQSNNRRGYTRGRYRGGNNQNGNRQEQVLRIVGSENYPGPSQERRALTAPTDSNVRFELLN